MKISYTESKPQLMCTEAPWRQWSADAKRGVTKFYPGSPLRRFGGGIRFREHLDKPLTQRLWQDLHHRLGICVFKFFHFKGEETTEGDLSRTARLYVDDNGYLQDIDITI